jgi:MerR family transcriptional regulator, light-induced transcriptional regulator
MHKTTQSDMPLSYSGAEDHSEGYGSAMTTDPRLSAGQAARQLGVAVTTIRTWDRRYGLGPERHEQGRHRRYGPRDMQRLQLMSRLVTDGVPAAEAARFARSAARPDQLTVPRARGVPERPAPPRVKGLRRAALTLDDEQLDRILREAVGEDVAAAWTRVICPVLRDIGRRHARTGQYVEVEHLLSRAVSAALAVTKRPDGPTAVLLTCAPEEQHSLPLEALAASLAARGARSRMLGARVPVAALEAAIVRTGPRAVVLWAHTLATANVAQLRVAMAARPRPALVAAAGPGWPPDRLPAGVHALTDFGHALDVLAEVALPSGGVR